MDDLSSPASSNDNKVAKETPSTAILSQPPIVTSQLHVLADAVQTHMSLPSQDTATSLVNTETIIGPHSDMETIARYLIHTVAVPVKIGKITIHDVASFLGPQEYRPRQPKKSSKPLDPFLRHNGFHYRCSSKIRGKNRYICTRYVHPFLNNSWITYSQFLAMKEFVNHHIEDVITQSHICPGVLEVVVDRHGNMVPGVVHEHTCDMQRDIDPIQPSRDLPISSHLENDSDACIPPVQPPVTDDIYEYNDSFEIEQHDTSMSANDELLQEAVMIVPQTIDAAAKRKLDSPTNSFFHQEEESNLSTTSSSQLESLIHIHPNAEHPDLNHAACLKFLSQLDQQEDIWVQREDVHYKIWTTTPIAVQVTSDHSFLKWYISQVLLLFPNKTHVKLTVWKELLVDNGCVNSIPKCRLLQCTELSAIIPIQATDIHYCAPYDGAAITKHFVLPNEMLTLPTSSSIVVVPQPVPIPSMWNYFLHLTFYDASDVNKYNVSLLCYIFYSNLFSET